VFVNIPMTCIVLSKNYVFHFRFRILKLRAAFNQTFTVIPFHVLSGKAVAPLLLCLHRFVFYTYACWLPAERRVPRVNDDVYFDVMFRHTHECVRCKPLCNSPSVIDS